MTEAYIYDHVRSPRGCGTSDGSLRAITPIKLASQVLSALRERNSLRRCAKRGENILGQ